MHSIPSLDTIFLVSAILGGGLFLIQLFFQFFGADLDGASDAFSGDASADVAFKVLSFQGLSAFFMMFGLTGLMFLREFALSAFVSLVGASAAGVGTAFIIQAIFRFFLGLQSSGTIDIHRAVGATGTVYLSIDKHKPGKVTVVVDNRQLIRNAIVEGREFLETGTPIRVVQVLSDGTLVVEKFTPER